MVQILFGLQKKKRDGLHSLCYLPLQVFGRHVATSRLVSGAYKTEYGDTSEIDNVMKRVQVGQIIMCF